MGQRIEPRCDICGTEKQHAPGIGLYCPNNSCGEEVQPVDDTPPAGGRFIRLATSSALMGIQEKLIAETSLKKIEAIDLYGVLTDGTERRITHLMVQVKPTVPDRRPGPTRMTPPSSRFPKGFPVTLASRDGVTLS